MTVDQVTSAIFEHVAPAVNAGAVGLWLLDEAAGVLRLVASAGYDPGAPDRVGEIRVSDPIPGAEVLSTREPITYRSRAELDLRWPVLSDVPSAAPAGAVLPLVVRGSAFGVVG